MWKNWFWTNVVYSLKYCQEEMILIVCKLFQFSQNIEASFDGEI